MGIGDWIKNVIGSDMPENPDELYELGMKYNEGEDTDIDYEKANKYFEAAMRLGHMDAIYELASNYRHGRGVAQDYARARKLFGEAELKGSAAAGCALGWMYEYGEGVPVDMQ